MSDLVTSSHSEKTCDRYCRRLWENLFYFKEHSSRVPVGFMAILDVSIKGSVDYANALWACGRLPQFFGEASAHAPSRFDAA